MFRLRVMFIIIHAIITGQPIITECFALSGLAFKSLSQPKPITPEESGKSYARITG